ncbi:MAG TPA: DNA/RNA nuclease SfsA [Thermoanaerobaculia bacterium]|nr:DNA/RNA nuclease SfsA [Thermoanaerobaculia bacterium]HUM31054.1 DNA/RNA nuclease SfsA [Thermoanaerobaculia bacterium]HXK69352.1 DNA/RNA nuclease SfsA [Thermoanaerobaculia bacterium]
MLLPAPIQPALFQDRRKRFLADCLFPDGRVETIHCPNSGSLRSCLEPGCPVLLSYHPEKGRSTRYTLEWSRMSDTWIGIHSRIANDLVLEALQNQAIPGLETYESLERERPFGNGRRVDFLLSREDQRCYLEVKSVTFLNDDGILKFPDAVTVRGRHHIDALIEERQRGSRAVLLFLVQRADGLAVAPAEEIDPDYADAMRRALREGVEIRAFRAEIFPPEMRVGQELPVLSHAPSRK